MLGVCQCVCSSLSAAFGILPIVGSIIADQGLQDTQGSVVVVRGLSSCFVLALEDRFSSFGAWTLLHGMLDLLGPGTEELLHWQENSLPLFTTSGNPYIFLSDLDVFYLFFWANSCS